MEVNRGHEKFVVAGGHEWFWDIFGNGTWEPETFRVFDKFLGREDTFLDIGAWIGPTVIYAQRRVKKVFAFEPDPVAYKSLVQNIELNDCRNVVPYPVAVSDEWKGIPFGARIGYGDSMSSQLWGKETEAKVAAVAFDSLIADTSATFIKIDIEGGERYLFDRAGIALEQLRPTIYLSLHTPWWKHDLEGFKEAIINGIGNYPYFYDGNLNPIRLEDAFKPDEFNAIVATYKEIA